LNSQTRTFDPFNRFLEAIMVTQRNLFQNRLQASLAAMDDIPGKGSKAEILEAVK
jgi:hypothetical protein